MAKYYHIKIFLQEYYKNKIQLGKKHIFDHFIVMDDPKWYLNT